MIQYILKEVIKMTVFELFEKYPWIANVFYSLITILIAIIFYNIFTSFIIKKFDNTKSKVFKNNKYGTYIKLFRSINKYLFLIIVIFILLKINGVNITSIITGVGVLGIIFGFAVQDALKDIVKGFDILTDSYYQVGDVIRIDKYTGIVKAIGIKTTKLEDIFEKNIVSISNRNIEQVEVLSHMINIDIPLPYDLKLKEAESIIEYILDEIKKIDKVEKVEYRGVNEFSDSNIKYQIKVYCLPIDKVQIRRNSLTCILRCLENKKIQIPFNQIDIHQKN